MKKFISYLSLLIVAILLTIKAVLYFADGYSDPYYLKVSSPKQSNLILGTSKSAQGLQPKFFNNVFKKNFYNYSFSINISPYGKTYLNSIKNKLDTTQNNSIFILSVDVWSISSITKKPNDYLHFRETKSFLKGVNNVTEIPNYNYLINYYDNKYYSILLKRTPFLLHNDGWLEVFLNDIKTSIDRRTSFTLESYNKKMIKYKFSSLRLDYLSKTIIFFKKYGKVYIVRLPVHPKLFKIENKLQPDFNSLIKPAIEVSNGYFDMTPYNKNYIYTDGVHLNKKSGESVSKTISNWIKKIQ